MKQYFILLLVIIAVITACSSSSDEAIKYNDAIIAKQQEVVNLFNKLDSSFSDTLDFSFIQFHQKLCNEIQSQLKTLDTIKPFDNKDDFKNEYKKLLLVYKQVADSDYSKLIKIRSLPDSLYTDVQHNTFIHIWEQSSQKIQHAINDFILFQKKFANTYKFTLSE